MAPMPATAAGTADPTARNLEATATPHVLPSAERATIEKVMAGNPSRTSFVVAAMPTSSDDVPRGDRERRGAATRGTGPGHPEVAGPGHPGTGWGVVPECGGRITFRGSPWGDLGTTPGVGFEGGLR